MEQTLLLTLSLLPLLLFVVVVIWMDAFSLTNWRRLAFCLCAGVLCFLLLHLLGHWLPDKAFKPYVMAVLSEFLKGLPLLYLVQRRKIVMLGDATIYGSAVGAGFGIGENIHIVLGETMGPGMAVLYGFEAAVMHIGCSSLLASGLIMAKQETSSRSYTVRNLSVILVFMAVCIVHIVHEKAPINPVLLTSILVVYFVLSKRHMFKKNEQNVHQWIDQCLNNDVALLASIKRGELSQTKAGQYLLSIREAFDKETFFDICCYISEYLELSILAKSNLILKEAGFPIRRSADTKARINELRMLRKRIGKSGVQAINPIVHIDDVDHWVVEAVV